MGQAGTWRNGELSAILIAQDLELAAEFCQAAGKARAFQIVAELKKYPTEQTLEIRLRQLRPDVVLVDVASDFDQAAKLLRFLSSVQPAVHVIGLHHSGDPDIILQTLQLGASEFFHEPFDPAVQRDAAAGILRLRGADSSEEAAAGKILGFSSAKPGSGASMLACQTAVALGHLTGGRILLADLDLAGGTVGFYLKVKHVHSMLDVMERCEYLDPAVWATLTTDRCGLDVLPAPSVPHDSPREADRLRAVLEQARRLYDWVILDLPSIFHQLSLLVLAETDSAFLVSTPELPSLHLARKAVALLGQLGIDGDRLKVLVNRLGKGDGMGMSDLEQIFNRRVFSCFPNDYSSLHKVVTLGEPLPADCGLGKAIGEFAGLLAGPVKNERRRAGFLMGRDPALAET